MCSSYLKGFRYVPGGSAEFFFVFKKNRDFSKSRFFTSLKHHNSLSFASNNTKTDVHVVQLLENVDI